MKKSALFLLPALLSLPSISLHAAALESAYTPYVEGFGRLTIRALPHGKYLVQHDRNPCNDHGCTEAFFPACVSELTDVGQPENPDGPSILRINDHLFLRSGGLPELGAKSPVTAVYQDPNGKSFTAPVFNRSEAMAKDSGSAKPCDPADGTDRSPGVSGSAANKSVTLPGVDGAITVRPGSNNGSFTPPAML